MGDGGRYTWPLTVRHYELGASGTARPEVYLNWMQEAGILASAHNGYPLERYEAIGAFWWVHRFLVEWHAYVAYGELLEATTWISRFSRIRALREYEIRRACDRSLVCSAQADWAFVNTATRHPTRVPDDMMECFPPSGVTAIASLPWSWHPAGTANTFSTHQQVRHHELDTMGHVNHAFYLVWLMDSLTACAESLDISADLDVLPVRLDIEYLHSARHGDPLVVTCRLVDFVEWNGPCGCWEHEIRLDGEESAIIRAHSLCRFAARAGDPMSACFRETGHGCLES